MMDRERVSLDPFCADVNDARLHSSMASSVRLVFLAYFSLLEQIESPPFVDSELQRIKREGTLRAPVAISPSVPLSQLALRRSGALRKTKRVFNSLAGVWDGATRCCDAVMAVDSQQHRQLADHPPGQLGSFQRQPAI